MLNSDVEQLQGAILECRRAIRQHRDQRGDDRCWLDDYLVWGVLEDTPTESREMPAYEDGMKCCKEFFDLRRAEDADVVPGDAVMDSAHWDDDLLRFSEDALVAELQKLQKAIRVHRDMSGRARTIEDDRTLYAVLPERLPADFRLPSEEVFIGGSQPGVGCPDFWKSHQACGVSQRNLHAWGPCRAS